MAARNESRVVSVRLKERMAEFGFTSKAALPEVVYTGSEEMQRGFLQALFSADGTVLDNVAKGVSVRLWSRRRRSAARRTAPAAQLWHLSASSTQDRKQAGYKGMPDGHGGCEAVLHPRRP